MKSLVIIISILISCSTARKETQKDYSTSLEFGTKAEEPSSKKQATTQQRILTYKGYITIEIDPEKSIETKKKIVEFIKTVNGYIVNESMNSLTFKVPADKFRTAIDEIRKLGRVLNESFSVEDITEAYYDAQIRLENSQKLQERLAELLKRAKTVQEAIEVEKELNRVTNEIETQKSRLFRLDNQIQFSTLSVNLQEKPKEKKLGPLGWFFYGIFKVVSFLFVIEDEQ